MFVKELDLEIKEARHIHPVHRNSIFLAQYIAQKHFKNVLEIGTGTGIIALHLAKKGSKVTATDIREDVVKAACNNGRLNNVHVNFVVSDLYKNVKGKYDCVIFIPPYFTSSSFSSFAFLFEKCLPWFLETRISYLLDIFFLKGKPSYPRRELLKRFLEETPSYLSRDGCIFLSVFKSDIPFLKLFSSFSYERISLPFFSNIIIFKITPLTRLNT
ncbi:methyltransferase [Candidatus Woesearchaeota archaeon]|nr:methyltransferase [Candidatus Woesearchaeota archaeon]